MSLNLLRLAVFPVALCAMISNAVATSQPDDPTPEPNPPAGALENGRYVITNSFSGKAMEVGGASVSNGANVVQYDYDGDTHQQWDVTNLGNGYYTLRPAHSGKSLDVYAWSTSDGGDLRQWEYLGGDNQQWQINAEGNGTYNIISRFSGKAVEVYDFNSSNGANIVQWEYWGGAPQLWRFALVGSSQPPTGNGKGSSCVSTGSVTVSSTIVVSSGVFDGGCKTYNPTSALGDGGQGEGQKPVFRVENGATLKNVIIGRNGADGIHFYGGGTIDNIRWTDIGEDGLTVKSQGDIVVRNIEAYDGYDKFMQINAAANITVSNCIVDGAGKFLRQNGGTGFTINVTVDNCDIKNMKEAVFRTDSSSSTARLTNSRIRNAGTICYGPWRSCTTSNVVEF
ncbi:hypothetical protein NBRC116494_33580 [Aurantivibrio plasticivorans]